MVEGFRKLEERRNPVSNEVKTPFDLNTKIYQSVCPEFYLSI